MLSLANPSRQNHIFNYREPVNNLVQHVRLGEGERTIIGHGWTAEQQAKVIQQLERNGARPATDVSRSMTRFFGLIYSDVRDVTPDEIADGFVAQLQTREDRTAEAATKAALGFDRSARQESRQRPKARTTETTVEQELVRGQRPTGKEVAFGLIVDPDGRSDVKLPV